MVQRLPYFYRAWPIGNSDKLEFQSYLVLFLTNKLFYFLFLIVGANSVMTYLESFRYLFFKIYTLRSVNDRDIQIFRKQQQRYKSIIVFFTVYRRKLIPLKIIKISGLYKDKQFLRSADRYRYILQH